MITELLHFIIKVLQTCSVIRDVIKLLQFNSHILLRRFLLLNGFKVLLNFFSHTATLENNQFEAFFCDIFFSFTFLLSLSHSTLTTFMCRNFREIERDAEYNNTTCQDGWKFIANLLGVYYRV